MFAPSKNVHELNIIKLNIIIFFIASSIFIYIHGGFNELFVIKSDVSKVRQKIVKHDLGEKSIRSFKKLYTLLLYQNKL
jgi:hypothetical protein